MYVIDRKSGNNERIATVRLEPQDAGPQASFAAGDPSFWCDARVFSRAGGVYGIWRCPVTEKSPGGISNEMLLRVAQAAWPGEAILLGA